MTGMNGFWVYCADLFLSLLFAEAFMATVAALVPHYIIGMVRCSLRGFPLCLLSPLGSVCLRL
jgi:hypothetical protein